MDPAKSMKKPGDVVGVMCHVAYDELGPMCYDWGNICAAFSDVIIFLVSVYVALVGRFAIERVQLLYRQRPYI
jgi:hypothetical protein